MALFYNRTKAEQTLLKAHEASPPSLSVDLFTECWRLNSGPNCLYHTPIATLLDDIRARRVPVDFIQILHTLRIPFYDGSLIVEIHDHRDQPVGGPMSERVVLWPNDETLYAEICLAASKDPGKWNDLDALAFEANHLLQREPDLILDPDPLVSKVANASLAVSTPLPVSFKRKRDAIDTAQEEEEKVQRARTMNLMNPRANKSFVPDFRVIDRILHRRQELNQAQAQSRESAGGGSSETKPQLSRHPPTQHPPQSMMARKADSPAPNMMLNDGPSSRRRSNATQPPPVAVPSVANNLRRRNGAMPPSGKAVDESSPKQSPTPQQPVPPPPTTQPPAVPAVAPRTITPVQKALPAALGPGKPPESNLAPQQPVQPSSPAVPAAQPLQSHPEAHPPRPPSQQATGAGPQTNPHQVPNGVSGLAARPTQLAQPSGAAQPQKNGTNGTQPLNRPQLPQQQPSGPPAQYQPSPAHMLRQQQAQSAAMTAGASNPRATATPTPTVQQAIAAARHPNNATPTPHQQLSQPHQPQPNPPAGPPANQQQTNFQGLNGAARYAGHGPSNVPGQQLPNGMQMPNIVQAMQQQRRLQAMNNSQNYPHQSQQNGQQASNAATLANLTAMGTAAAQQPTGQIQRPTPMGAGGNQNPTAMAQFLPAARTQPQHNAQLLFHQQIQQQRAQQVPPGAAAQQQQSQQPPQAAPRGLPPQQQQGALPNLQQLSQAQLQNFVQQLLSQPGTTPQQQQQRQTHVKALLAQMQANNAAANAGNAGGPPQGSANATNPVPMNPNVAAMIALAQNGHQQQAANIMQQLQTANPGVNIQALLQNYHQRQRLQHAQSQAIPQNPQSSQAVPAQTQTQPHPGTSPHPNPPFALGSLPPNYIPNWRGRGGVAPGNVQQGQQPAAPGGLGRGGR